MRTFESIKHQRDRQQDKKNVRKEKQQKLNEIVVVTAIENGSIKTSKLSSELKSIDCASFSGQFVSAFCALTAMVMKKIEFVWQRLKLQRLWFCSHSLGS